jgi:hypothetical protein
VAGDRSFRFLRRHDASPLSQDFRRRCALLSEARALAERIFEFSEFLLHVAKRQTDDQGSPGTCRAAYLLRRPSRDGYAPARARAAGQLPGVEVALHTHESECCGFGGTFSLKHPAISSAMASDKVEALKETGAQTFLSADCGCMLNLNHTLQKRGTPCRASIWRLSCGSAPVLAKGAAMSARDQHPATSAGGAAGLRRRCRPTCRLSMRRAAPAGGSTRAARIELFCEKMAFWHGEVVRVTRANWPQKLARVLRDQRRALAAPRRAAHGGAAAAGIGGLKPYDRPVGRRRRAAAAQLPRRHGFR